MRTVLAAAVVVAASLIAMAANATSSLWSRNMASTTIRTCNGKLTEQVIEGGSVMYSFARYRIACTTGTTAADWIFATGSSCGGASPGLCEGRPQARYFNLMKLLAGHPEKIGRLVIEVPKAALGVNCRATVVSEARTDLRKPAFSVEDDERAHYWVCEKWAVYQARGTERFRFEVVTTSIGVETPISFSRDAPILTNLNIEQQTYHSSP